MHFWKKTDKTNEKAPEPTAASPTATLDDFTALAACHGNEDRVELKQLAEKFAMGEQIDIALALRLCAQSRSKIVTHPGLDGVEGGYRSAGPTGIATSRSVKVGRVSHAPRPEELFGTLVATWRALSRLEPIAQDHEAALDAKQKTSEAMKAANDARMALASEVASFRVHDPFGEEATRRHKAYCEATTEHRKATERFQVATSAKQNVATLNTAMLEWLSNGDLALHRGVTVFTEADWR